MASKSLTFTLKAIDTLSPVMENVAKSMERAQKMADKLSKSIDSAGGGKASKVLSSAFSSISGHLGKGAEMADKFDGKLLKSSIKAQGLSKALGGVGVAIQAATLYGKTLQSIIKNTTKFAEKLGRSSQTFWANLAGGLQVFDRIKDSIGDVMSTVDSMRSSIARADLFSSGMSGNEFFNQAYRIAQDTRSDLQETMSLANKIMLSGVFDTNNAEKALHLTELINKTLIAGGETQESNNRALLQFNQAMASGIMQGDELRSLREQTPYLMKVLAEGLGKVDEKFEGLGIGDLKALGAQGELTSDRIARAFWLMEDEIDKAFKTMPRTWGQGITVLQNWWAKFLTSLSMTSGPLERLIDLFWNFIDTITYGDMGRTIIEGLTVAIDVLVSAIEWLYFKAVEVFTWLTEHPREVQAALIALAGVAAIAFASIAANALMACWPILLMGAIFTDNVFEMSQAGYTLSEILGAIGEGIGNLAAWIVSTLIPTMAQAIQIILKIAQGITNVIAVITSVILVIIALVVATFQTAGHIIASLWNILRAGAAIVANEIMIGTRDMCSGIVEMIQDVTNALDKLFGTNYGAGFSKLTDRVNNWMDKEIEYNKKLIEKGSSEYSEEGIKSDIDSIAKTFHDIVGPSKGLFTLASGLGKAGETIGKLGDMSASIDTSQWGQQGKAIGENLGNKITDLMGKEGDDTVSDKVKKWMEDMAKQGDGQPGSGGKNNVGTVDKVKNVDGDVSIKDEDIKLMRDMAARDVLVNLRSATPVANISFGDVRETADVNQIMRVIETMVEEQLATSMVS